MDAERGERDTVDPDAERRRDWTMRTYTAQQSDTTIMRGESLRRQSTTPPRCTATSGRESAARDAYDYSELHVHRDDVGYHDKPATEADVGEITIPASLQHGNVT